jgi:succinate dehydrogenase/fumarate reductase flavoprotein subunit
MDNQRGQGPATVECDLLVIGSGAAGLSAAITARKQGLRVIVVEKDAKLGGTTAVSGGWAWIPGSSVAARAGVSDSKEAARTYLRHETGERYSERHVEAYLEFGPKAIDFLERETAVRFAASPTFPDYHSEAPGAALGRSIVAEPYDARELGPALPLLRMPLPQTTLFGMNVGSGTELTHFFRATRSLTSAIFVVRRMVKHAVDVVRYGRGTRLANGNALTARLLKSANDAGVEFVLSAAARELVIENGAVRGAVVDAREGPRTFRARSGVVLACGGFSQDVGFRKRLFAHAPTGLEHASPVPAGNTGDGLRLGETAGGSVVEGLPNAAAWMPVSIVKLRDGSPAVFPHVIDRAKPGMIAVTRAGKRFVNESNSYHDFGQAFVAATRSDPDPAVFLVCDHRAIRKYGLGYAKPFPFPLRGLVNSGYLYKGNTLSELATAAGMNATSFDATMREFNTDARQGRDSRMAKGSTRYNRFQGDAMHHPNACVAPIEQGPFYAVRIVLGDIGTFAGLAADEFARVMDKSGRPVQGLYVAGNDMCSIMGGNYPGAGINIGPAITFGYIAGLHAAGKLGTRVSVPSLREPDLDPNRERIHS